MGACFFQARHRVDEFHDAGGGQALRFWFQPAISFGGNPKASQKGQHPLLFLGLLHVAPGHSGGRVDHERLFLALIFFAPF